jgi:DNA repair protein RadC
MADPVPEPYQQTEQSFEELSFSDQPNSSNEFHPNVTAPSHYALPVRELPKEEQPQERLLDKGAAALSITELLSLLFGTIDEPYATTLELASRALQTLSDDDDFLAQLRHITIDELTGIHGIGLTRAAALVSAIELGKRVFFQSRSIGTIVDDPAVAASAFSVDLMWEAEERFAILFLNVKHRIVSRKILTIGSATETIAYPRDIFSEALRRQATQIIVAHNHPSHDLTPSKEDLTLTRNLIESGRLLGVPVLDHLILGGGTFVSIRETTTLWNGFPQDGTEEELMVHVEKNRPPYLQKLSE